MVKTIYFGNIIEELARENVSIVFLKDRGIFLGDENNTLYAVVDRDSALYLDDLIKTGKTISFQLMPKTVSDTIGDWEKETWGIKEIKQFMKRQKISINRVNK